MSELNFSPMDDREISNFRVLSEIINELREVTGVTLVGIRQYASSTDGKIANRQILVGASYENAQTKDLKALLKLSPSCSDLYKTKTLSKVYQVRRLIRRKVDGKIKRHRILIPKVEYFNTFINESSKDREHMNLIVEQIHKLDPPDFSEFYTSELTDPNLFYGAWLNTIQSIVAPNENRSAGQNNAYEQVCTGVFQHTEEQSRYYIRGYEISSQILAPAINPRNPSSNPTVIAQNAIKFGLGLMMVKYRTLHLREDDTRIRISGNEITIAMTAQKIREVTATNEIKSLKKEIKSLKKTIKELEKK